ncbi:MAG TPA: hypothetical protein VJ864_14410, partial [Candidatus Binatia bacterium]|nr:hypothetical protein [Candidatus Binatia bacterium]
GERGPVGEQGPRRKNGKAFGEVKRRIRACSRHLLSKIWIHPSIQIHFGAVKTLLKLTATSQFNDMAELPEFLSSAVLQTSAISGG